MSPGAKKFNFRLNNPKEIKWYVNIKFAVVKILYSLTFYRPNMYINR